MLKVFRELLDTERQLEETSRELSQMRETLNFSIEEKDKQEKKFNELLKDILKVTDRNNYNRPEKMKLNKIKELIYTYNPKINSI